MPESDRDVALDLYRLMSRIRQFEDRIHADVIDNRFEGYVHCYAGEEAVGVGVIHQLREDDWLTSTYRNHGHAIARDVPLEAITGELIGRVDRASRRQGRLDACRRPEPGMIGGIGIVAAGLPIAAGAAFAAKTRGRTASRWPSSATEPSTRERGTKRSSSPALFGVPVIFVCENNLYAETTAIDYHLLPRSVAAMAGPTACLTAQVDGMDVFAVRRAAEQAIPNARAVAVGRRSSRR